MLDEPASTTAPAPVAASRPITMQRALFWLLLLALLPLAIGAGVVLWQQIERDREVATQQLVGAAGSIALAVERELAAGLAELGVLAHSPLIDIGDWATLTTLLTNVVAQREGTHLALVDPAGQLVVSTAAAGGAPLSNLWQLQGRTEEWQGRSLPLGSQLLTSSVFASGGPAASGLYYGVYLGRPAVGIAVPVWREGEVRYALLQSFDPGLFAPALQLPGLDDDAGVTLFDAAGRVILALGAGAAATAEPADPALRPLFERGARATGGPGSEVTTDFDGSPHWRALATSGFTGWRVVVTMPRRAALAGATESAQTWGALFLIAVLGSAVLASVLSRRITAPFAELAAATRAALQGETPRMPASRFLEIDALGAALVEAADRERQRRDEMRARAEAEQRESLALQSARIARAAEHRLRNLIDNLFAFVGILDLDGRVAEVNRAPLERAALSRADVLGRPFWECWWWQHDEHAGRRVREAVREALAGRSTRFDIEAQMAGGRLITIDLQIEPLRDDDGRVVQLIPSGVDVTDRIEAVRAMRESENRFRALADNMSQLAWIADAGGRATWYNRRWQEFTGIDPGAGDGEAWRDVIEPDDLPAVIASFGHSVATGREWEHTFRMRAAADGEYRWFLSRAVPIRNERGEVVRWFGTNTDITGQREIEHALRDSERLLIENQLRLREADRQKDRFIATLAHELRNPLAPILTSAQIVGMRAEPGSDIERAQQTIERQARHMARLVDDLLDISRIRHGRLVLKRERCELTDVVAAAVETVRPPLDAAGHRLLIGLERRPMPLEADPMRLSQALLNVLSNAVKFSPPGSEIRIAAAVGDGEVRLDVVDRGIGIPAELHEHIFEMFVQERRSGVGGQTGLGIGLALSRSLIEMHGGTIAVASAGRDAGSTFTIRLPLAVAAAVAEPAPERPATAASPRRILIVDDNVDAAEALGTMLSLLGHATHVAHDGAGALRLYDLHRPDVVLLDIGLPDISGYEVARRLREAHGDALGALIALTGWGQEADKQKAASAGFRYHFTKPAHPADIAHVLAELD
jgi:PAS domain S-box-containing protein